MSEAPNASLLTMIILNGEGVEASGAGGFGGRGTGVSRAAAARFGRGLGAAFFSGASAAGRDPETLNTDSPVGAMRWSRSEEHTSELQSLMRISYAVFCLKKKKKINSES